MGGYISQYLWPEENMAGYPKLTIPTKLESNLVLGDGSQGENLQEAFSFQSNQIDNLYSWDSSKKEFKLTFQERGVAYGDSDPSEQLAELTLNDLSDTVTFQLVFDATPVDKWGLNFVGVVRVKHENGDERLIYLPGTRTYDPAGMTGDPHASERIGPSCSRTQAAITIAELVAVLHGASGDQLDQLQEKLRPLIERYHGRVALFDWMLLQIQEAVIENKDVTPYPEFIKSLIASNNLKLTENRAHTRSYIESYNKAHPTPPLQYYKKVAAKDKVEEILSDHDLETFKSITSQ